MVKATIKSKTGAHIIIEGTEKEVAGIVSAFENMSNVTQFKDERNKKNIVKKEQKKRATASDLIVTLKEEGYFDKPKNLTEISSKLEEKGHVYPVTTLSGVMIGLVQNKLFGRKKVEGKWVYGK
jgi:hypothetical protein